MKRILFSLSLLILSITSCKKDDSEEAVISPVIGLWEITQTATTHELGHFGPYDPPVRDIDSRQTVIIDHQNEFSTLDVSSSSLIWTDVDSLPKTYNWAYENMLFTLTDSDTTLEYHVTELTSQTFVFFIKDFRTYNDSTDFVAYEEFEYVYRLDKVNN